MNETHIFINELTPGQGLDQVFVVRDKDLRTTKNGGNYILCTLVDKTGSLPGRMWQASESIFMSIPSGGYLHVKGRTEDYKGSLQFIIEACRPMSEDKVNVGDFLAVAEADPEEMWSELLEILRGVKNKSLRLLIKKFVEDREFVATFKKAPAAMTMHNPYQGGLLEHTLAMARAAVALLGLYPKLNADLALTGIFFHDMGKMAELTSGVAINYTDRGNLVGHITMGVIWLDRKAALVAEETGEPFPQKTLDLLQHMILSHHGSHEYGSPKLPMIPEAFFLHYLDNLDAKMFMTFHDIESVSGDEESFGPYNRSLATRIFRKSGSLD